MTHRSTRAGLAALLALATACGGQTMQAPVPEPVRPRVIAVLGDSLSVSPSPDESFPAVLQRRLEKEGRAWRVVSFGQNGDTTADGLTRLDDLLAEQPDILVLALGANDGVRGVPLDTVWQNLDTIITRAQAAGVGVLLCGMEAPPNFGSEYTREFRSVFADLANAHDVAFLPFFLDGVAGDSALNQSDGIHPNVEGTRRVADLVWRSLEPLLERSSTPS